MIHDLDIIIEKTQRIVTINQKLMDENRALQTTIGTQDAEIKRLRETLEATRERVSKLINLLPESTADLQANPESLD